MGQKNQGNQVKQMNQMKQQNPMQQNPVNQQEMQIQPNDADTESTGTMEDEKRLERQWRNTHLRLTLIFSILVSASEFATFFVMRRRDMIQIAVKGYFLKYILIPFFCYLLINFTEQLLVRYGRISDKARNYVVSVSFAVIGLLVCFFHDYFVAMYASGAAVIALTTVYGDRILTSVTTVITIIGDIFIAAFAQWDPTTVRDGDYVINVVYLMLILLCCYMITLSIVLWEEKRRHAAVVQQRVMDSLREAAEIDQLTGCRNRLGLRRYIDLHQPPVLFAMMDINYFKTVNDKWGHQLGDEVLVSLGAVLLAHENEKTAVFRYGGDEFLVAAHGGNMDQFCILCEEICSEFLERLPAKVRQNKVSLSFGTAMMQQGDPPADAIHRADARLYEVKEHDR